MREMMMNEVIRKFGMSDRRVYAFCRMCETAPTNLLGKALVETEYEALMAESIFAEE